MRRIVILDMTDIRKVAEVKDDVRALRHDEILRSVIIDRLHHVLLVPIDTSLMWKQWFAYRHTYALYHDNQRLDTLLATRLNLNNICPLTRSMVLCDVALYFDDLFLTFEG